MMERQTDRQACEQDVRTYLEIGFGKEWKDKLIDRLLKTMKDKLRDRLMRRNVDKFRDRLVKRM